MGEITFENASDFVDLLDAEDPDVWSDDYCYVCLRRIPLNPTNICTNYNYSSHYWYTGVACETVTNTTILINNSLITQKRYIN